MRKVILTLLLLGLTNLLPAQSLSELLQQFETGIATLSAGLQTLSSGVSELRQDSASLNEGLLKLSSDVTSSGARLDRFESSWNEQKRATDALVAAQDGKIAGLQREIWVDRGIMALLAALAIWAAVR